MCVAVAGRNVPKCRNSPPTRIIGTSRVAVIFCVTFPSEIHRPVISPPLTAPHNRVNVLTLTFPAGVSILPHSPHTGTQVRSKSRKWPLPGKRSFNLSVRCRLCTAISRFRGAKSSKNFWPAGAPPQGRRAADQGRRGHQGRRGRVASRPARPGRLEGGAEPTYLPCWSERMPSKRGSMDALVAIPPTSVSGWWLVVAAVDAPWVRGGG